MRITLPMTTIETKNKMKLSKQTIDILKNFSGINSNLHIVPGQNQVTVSPMKNIMVEVEFEEEFPVEFAIWDLSKFLGVLSLFDEPELEFNEKHVNISSGSTDVVYHYAERKLVKGCRPDREFNMPETVIHFNMSNREFVELQRASSVLRLPDLCITDNNGSIDLISLDKNDPTSNKYSISVSDDAPDASFKMYLKSEYLKLLPGDYSVAISDKVVSRLVHSDINLTYYIALDSDSVYNG
jgi:hypothetical protein